MARENATLPKTQVRGVYNKMRSNYFTIERPYPDNLIEHYAVLADLPGFVLLESGDQQRGRYDLVSACPNQQFACADPSDIQRYLDDLEQALPQYELPVDLPFQGGLIGYFSYEFGAHRLGIPVARQQVFDGPSPLLSEFGWYDWALIIDHQLQRVTLFAANVFLETAAVVLEVLARWERPRSRAPHPPGGHLLPVSGAKGKETALIESDFSPLISKDAYAESFAAIWKALYDGRCYQVNYTQPFSAAYQGDAWTIFEKMRLQNPVPFSAYWRGEHYSLLSFSPERFLTHDQGKLLTSPIKGTVARGADQAQDDALGEALLKSEKNRAENTMIVDLWRNDFSKIAETGSVVVTQLCALESYRSVHHLVSTIEAQRKSSISPIAAFLHCFPGGSITGAPKREAMRVIAEQEPFARGPYCGSMVYFSAHGRFDSSILIRTLLADEKTLSLSAGGGIVIDSQWEEEYAECFIKIQSLRNSLRK